MTETAEIITGNALPIVDPYLGCFHTGYATMRGPQLPIIRDRETLLIACDGHFIGRRPFCGGRYMVWREKEYLYDQFSFVVDGTIHVALVVHGTPSMVKNTDIPAPFDKWAMGREILPYRQIDKPARPA